MRAVLTVVFAALSVLLAADVRYGGASLPAEGPRRTLARVLGDGAPHPTGTVALAAVRARIAAAFQELGAPVEERVLTACGRYGACARVHQLVARVAGRDSTGVVAWVAHADAVGASGGASDDGAGVAALIEVAKSAVKTGARNDLLFVVLEGEELGLIGAEAFLAGDPRAAEVRVVVNLEARGVRGPALLFQTSRAGGTLVGWATRAMRRPVGSSLFAAVYERMPNDTDLTVFLDHGKAGLNLAFSDGVEAYHTSRDDFAHQEPQSLAHLTESALGAAEALGAADLRTLGPRESVWFDVLGLFVIAWPAPWSLPLATLALLSISLSTLRALRARAVRGSALATSLAAWAGCVAIAALFGGFAKLCLEPPTPWIAHPGGLLYALFALPVFASLGVACALGSRVTVESTALATAIAHGLLGLLLSRLLPAASYLLVVPALVSAASIPLLARRPTVGVALPALAGLLAAALVLRTLYPGLGAVVAPVIPLVSSLFVLPFAPLWALPSRRAVGAATAAVGVSIVAAVALHLARDPFSPDAPRRVNVVHAEEEGAPRAFTAVDPTWGGTPWGEAPREMIAALGPEARERYPFPWMLHKMWLAEAPTLGLPGPEAEVLERTATRARVRLRSRRGAATIIVLAPPESGLASLDLEGSLTPARTSAWGLSPGWRALRLEGFDAAVLSVELRAGTGELIVLDATDGVPPMLAGVVAARPADAVPAQDGDRTVVYRRFKP
jgi:hypothetical protein